MDNRYYSQRPFSSSLPQTSKFSSRNTPNFAHNYQDDDDIDDDEESLNYDELNEKDPNFENYEEEEEMGRFNFSQNPNKKRKMKNVLNYEFAPRVSSSNYNNVPGSWTENETFLLLEAWGNKYLGQGRKSLRSEDWNEVAERVSEVSEIERTDSECRNRLDTLKKKYKKEKARLEECGGTGGSKWVYFKRMDMLLGDFRTKGGQCGLACGVDSGEYVFMNPRVYLNCSNGFDEMRDSPGNSEEEDDDEEEGGGEDEERSLSYKSLADSIQKFGEIYEKIEKNKRQQMIELEKMRMDFHKELELQKKQIMDKVQVEIEKISEDNNIEDGDVGCGDDTDVSVENLSG